MIYYSIVSIVLYEIKWGQNWGQTNVKNVKCPANTGFSEHF